MEAEVRAQIERAYALGIRPTHLDAHILTAFSSPGLLRIYLRMGRAYGVPQLLLRPSKEKMRAEFKMPTDLVLVDRVIEMEPGIDAPDWLDWYKRSLAALKPGVYQLVVHLAYDDDEMRGATRDHPDWGAAWRQQDFDLVKSAEFRQFLKNQGFILVSWRDLAKALPEDYRKSGDRPG